MSAEDPHPAAAAAAGPGLPDLLAGAAALAGELADAGERLQSALPPPTGADAPGALQEIDRMTQSLHDLSAVLAGSAAALAAAGAPPLDARALARTARLASVRDRLLPRDGDGDGSEAGRVTWF